MTDPDGSYRPRSPDFSSFTVPPPSADTLPSPLAHRASYDASPFFAAPPSRIPQPYVPPRATPRFDMGRRVTRAAAAALIPPFPPSIIDRHASAPAPFPAAEPAQLRPWDGIEVKTKFPVARIKRIMQADEDVGKVAQVTPIAVAKALELFMISLVTKAAQEARERNSKRVTAAHLKQAVAKDEVLDFLVDIIAKVPDPAGKKPDDDGGDLPRDRHTPGRKRAADTAIRS